MFLVEPKFPLFDGVHDPKVRALIAIGLGCDAFPGGVPGLGPSSLHNLLEGCETEGAGIHHEQLAMKLCVQKRAVVKDARAILCIANSLMYEKTNSEVGYMYDVPQAIELYNKAFAAPMTQVIDGPAFLECKGCSGQAHSFLEAEGVFMCVSCQSNLCRFCTWEDSEESDVSEDRHIIHYCLECKRSSLGSDNDNMTEQEMRKYLKEHAVNIPVTASYADVLRMYEQYDEDEHAIFAGDIRTVRYPVLPTSSLNPSHESYNNIERIKQVDMSSIGELVSSESVDCSSVIDFVHLVSSLAVTQQRTSGEKLSYKHVVPLNLLNMAVNARVHNGERLIRRGIRHAMDQATPSIYSGKLTLGRYEGEICIVIENKVRASMKNFEYNPKSAITPIHFVATECNCKAGSCNTPTESIALADVGRGRIICSHGMTLPVQLSLALYKGLAAHILSELRLRLKRDDIEDKFNGDRLIILRRDITQLFRAAGKTDTAMDMTRSIVQCLDVFAVGTDLPKKAPAEPLPHDLGLLRDKCRYYNPVKAAEQTILKGDELDIDNITEAPANELLNVDVDYSLAQQSVDALSMVFEMKEFWGLTADSTTSVVELPIGLSLLRDRASCVLDGQEYNVRNRSTSQLASKWKIALLEWTTERKHPRWQPGTTSDSNQSKKSTKRKASEVTNGKCYSHKRCSIEGCNGNEHNAELIRVPGYPPPLPINPSRTRQHTYHKKMFIRSERTERMKLTRDYEANCEDDQYIHELRACQEHWVEVTGKWVTADIVQKDGSTITEKIPIEPFWAPVYIGKNSFDSPPQQLSKGNATDRATLRHVNDLKTNDYALAQQQFVEMTDVQERNHDLSQINSRVLAVAGLDVHSTIEDVSVLRAKKRNARKKVANAGGKDPVLMLKHLTPKEVKRLTGFEDLKHLLSYVTMICDGDMTTMTRTTSALTWLEEWVLCLEFVWGHCMNRCTDYETVYKCRSKSVRKVIRGRVRQILCMRERWPMYASYAEDAKFRDAQWNGHFDQTTGHRVVMHDSTNIPMATPTDAAMQRALYNSYYGMCCAKAGVAVQLCSWIHGLPLNTGHSDDTRFIQDTEILQKQKIFAENDKSSTKPFLNIFDKGYQCTLMASQHNQKCLQPAFAEFDKQFADNMTLYSGAVAVVRSGNERAVNRCKMSWVLKKGAVEQKWDVDFLCDVWEAWTFQVNFMFAKFL